MLHNLEKGKRKREPKIKGKILLLKEVLIPKKKTTTTGNRNKFSL